LRIAISEGKRDIDLASISTIFLLDCGTVPIFGIFCCFAFHLLCQVKRNIQVISEQERNQENVAKAF